ncbi:MULTISPECIES: 2-hydroxyacid dehydrogenase [Achromobacter]|uniref:2-hydroxyacid dehydrogenase n=1 Tax=Achromobacter spanius TaxID=217203 RepID=A0ABY8GXW3_9BURK|nr:MULTISPECIES: 2-hydroxyacid dehydrogenase [Achromobacter]WAI81418.1 2-hydroxyacid dehydrogenase [Achromobacter spanius]WEX96935.1 2-hydroxyacid dehydrogenase [Achromobacter sp. SS2-2022]WFP09348.1 2-hydroxyacid dehydrogenase [Achromobacter spanius]
MTIPLLILIDSVQDYLPEIQARGFQPLYAPTDRAREQAIQDHAGDIRIVLTRGATGLRADEIAAMPKLELVCSLGVGYENIDLAAAAARGIVVTNGPGANAISVADHAMALLLGAARHLPQADAWVRQGHWNGFMGPQVTGKRLGILGLGTIGLEIARRGANGFGMRVGYYNRRPRPESGYTYFDNPRALAAASDFLVIATPGGAGTRHLVDADVLQALGPDGYLVNIARGSVVDTDALIAALASRRIAGAGLDVVDGEPHIPAALKQLDNVVLTPHSAGRSPEAVAATVALFLQNATAHFDGKPVLTPVRDAHAEAA